MRISRLDLKKYGRFTESVLDFPAGKNDFHLVYGPNEAGKSTTLSAISDLLFGIPHNSPYNFLHSYGEMRIGGLLQAETGTIEFSRRKGKKDTLLSVDGSPHPSGERALSPFLGGYDRVFFERMFSLDYQRLNEGGREILDAGDDAGQILFSAGTGLPGLKKHLESLEGKIDGLWGARRSSRRRYTQLEDSLKENERKLREHSLSGAKWLELKEDLLKVQGECDRIDQQISMKTLSLRKLERVRRVFRDVSRLDQIESEIASIGPLPVLPGNAREKLESAQEKIAEARIQGETLKSRLQDAFAERESIHKDEKILARATEIGRLHEVRIQIQKAQEDLPKRQAELVSLVSELSSLSRELSWEPMDVEHLLSKIPGRARSLSVSRLISEREGLISLLTGAEKSLLETRLSLESLEKKHRSRQAPVDLSELELALSSFRSRSSALSLSGTLREELLSCNFQIELALSSLFPPEKSLENLLSVNAPGVGLITGFRDRIAACEEELKEFSRRIQSVRQEIGGLSSTLDGILQRDQPVTKAVLEKLREKRDHFWELVKRIHVHGDAVPGSEVEENTGKIDPVPLFEEAQREVDIASDRRFDKAEVEARVGVIAQKIDEHKGVLAELLSQNAESLSVRDGLLSEWVGLWGQAPFLPASPELMLKWFRDREAVFEWVSRRKLCEEKIRSVSAEISLFQNLLSREISKIGGKQLVSGDESLDTLAEMAQRLIRELSDGAALWKLEEEQILKLEEEAKRKQAELDVAKKEIGIWEVAWKNALSETVLPFLESTDAVSHLLESIDRMRALSEPVRDLSHRVQSIQKDAVNFKRMVQEMIPLVAPDLSGESPEDSMRTIEKRLDQALLAVELYEQKDQDIRALSQSVQHYREVDREASGTISLLLEASQLPDATSLAGAISRQERVLALEQEKEALKISLLRNGDGFSLKELEKEVREVPDPAVLGDMVAILLEEIESLRSSQKELLEKRTRLDNEFSALGGDLVAVEAASDRQTVLSEMREVAEQVVYLKGASILLKWSMDRYRKENQGPLLLKASGLFSHLTLGSFDSLGVDYDDEDRVRILGFRKDGSAIGVSQMSTGTADQLFLAIRLSAVDDFLGHSAAFPFVADDLLINLDDQRAKAALKVLWSLSEKTQVIFLTHHQHLVDLGRETLGEQMPVSLLVSGQ